MLWRLVAATILVSAAAALAPGIPPARAQLEELLGPPPAEPMVTTYSNPVLAGDHPDPSVIRDGKDYWGVVTAGAWEPPFTVLHSNDLVNWNAVGSVLRRRPAWARTNLWAPEITKRGNGFAVYYAALSRAGRFCVGVATGKVPWGRFRDRGPLVCPKLGAIDPMPVHDEHGRPHLLWKEDGNAKRAPTRIFAQRLSLDGVRVVGPAREILRNEAPWEGGVVEAPALTRHGGYLYLLYSARACCGPGCEYATGVARSRTLLGPWEKRPGPILEGNERFRCPGHVSAVDTPAGETWLAYHAYSRRNGPGRAMLIDRLDWGSDGWPRVNEGRGPSRSATPPGGSAQRPSVDFVDEFTGAYVAPGWQWPERPDRLRLDRRAGGRLVVGPVRGRRRTRPGVVGRQPGFGDYVATAVVGARRRGARPGLAAYAGPRHGVGIELRGGRAVVWQLAAGRMRTLATAPLAPERATILRMRVKHGNVASFELLAGGAWRPVGRDAHVVQLLYDDVHAVLRVTGPRGATAAFERFELSSAGLPPETGPQERPRP